MISNFTFFKYGSKFNNEDFNSKIVLNMRPVRLYKGDMILRENDRVNELVFVNQGAVSAQLTYNNCTAKIFELRKFDHFGDIFVLSNDGCPVDLMVKSKTCELFIINKDELLNIAKEFPDICNEIFRVSSKNYRRMKLMIDKKKRKLEYESGNKDNVISELLKLKKSDLNNSDIEEEEEEDDNQEEEQESILDIDKKEKTKDLISTVNLDVIKEADENDDDEIKCENDKEMQEGGEFSPIKSLAKSIDDKEYINIFLNKVNFPDNNKYLKESFKDISDNNSKSLNLMQKETFQSFKNFEDLQTKKDEIFIEREENTNNYEKTLLTKSSLQLNQSPEEDSQSLHDSTHNSISIGKKQYKEETTAPDVSAVNSINNYFSDKKINQNLINERIENDETCALSILKENGNKKNNATEFSKIKDGLSHSLSPFSLKINSFKNIDNEDVKSQDFNDQNLFKNSKSSTNMNSDTNIENVAIKAMKESDNINVTLPNDLKDNLVTTNDDKKDKNSIDENSKGNSLEHKKQEKTEPFKLENLFSLTKKDSDLGSVFSKDRNKFNNSITSNELKVNNKFNKTIICSNENDIQKKNSILKFPETRKTIVRLSKKDDALKPKKNIIQNIKSQIEASVKIDKDPTNFMLRELNKVEKKLIGYKRKEMKDLIIKLDEIYDMISKYK